MRTFRTRRPLLVNATQCLHPTRCVCLFTRIPAFFEHLRFRIADRQALRDKVLKDCVLCARRNACDEIAMAIRELPEPRATPWPGFPPPRHHADLVQLQL